jgi:hypothetical protein
MYKLSYDAAKSFTPITQIVALPDVRQRMFELGYETVASSPPEFAEFMRTNTAQFAKIISGAGIRPE